MKSGSKYHPLFEHLRRSKQETVELTFAEIETLMDSSLPTSAFSKKNWWSNRDGSGALQAGAWVSAGYKIESVDLNQQVVKFRQFQASYSVQKKDGAIVWTQDAIKALRKHMALTQSEFALKLGVRRQTVSEWENGVYDPDRSTTKFLALIAQQSEFKPTFSQD
jgi:DNA-binding transcriptional regulator YiaG